MASMNYCFTVCRAADEKVQQETNSQRTSPVDIPKGKNPNNLGGYFFGKFFSFNLTPPLANSTVSFSHSFTVKASSSFTDLEEDLF